MSGKIIDSFSAAVSAMGSANMWTTTVAAVVFIF
jgi:hypothetical protein